MILQMYHECVIVCFYYRLLFFIEFTTIGTFRISKSYSTLCIRFCSFVHFYVTLTLPTRSADVGLVEVVSVIAILKCHFRPDEGFNAETLTEISKI